jgi:hypothetical protein
MTSILRKGFILLLLILFVALVGVLIFAGDGLFGSAVQRYGPVAFGQPVRFADAELSILGGSAGLTDFHVGAEDNPLIDVGQASVNIGTMALIGGRVHIENAELAETTVHLIVREDGTLGFDPGPPPEDIQDADPLPPREKPLPKQENRDFVQIAMEYWERAQHYKEYYDKVKAMRGSEEAAEEEAALERVKYPGMPDYVTALQSNAPEAKQGVFWMDRAAITNFHWETIDKRNGKAILPAIADFSFELTDLGTPPTDGHPFSGFTGQGSLVEGGALQFDLKMSRTEAPSTLTFSLQDVPVDSVLDMMRRSLPFRVQGGKVNLGCEDIRFSESMLAGSVRLELRGAKVTAKSTSPQVLGVDPGEFSSLLNSALQDQPIAFQIILGGTPSSPSFTIQNETDIGDLLGGAVKAEVERRAQEFIDDQTDKITEKANELIDDKLGDVIGDKIPGGTDGIKDQLKKGLDTGGLFGGKKKDG